jgi:enamine deaminase RidA (YjgF/YER057c/UK114 family)
MERQVVNPWAWQDRHGFVQAVAVTAATRVLVCAGQASTSPEGITLHPGDLRAQIRQALDNLEVVLAQAGFTLGDVVRLNYFCTDLDRFFQENDDIKRRLAEAGCRCASSMYGITRLGNPDLLIEIEALAMA